MKKAYTLIEIILVVIIIAILIGVFGFFIPDRNNEQIKFGKECSNYIYHSIETKINNIKTNKGVLIPGWMNNTLCYTKILVISTLNNGNIEISISCEKAGLPGLEEYLTTAQFQCNTDINNKNQYFIKTSSTGRVIVFNKKLEITNLLNKTDSFFETNVCNDLSNPTTCIPISKIIFNQTTQKIEQKFCLDFTGPTCNEWEQ